MNIVEFPDVRLVAKLFEKEVSPTFRYFQKRNFDCIHNHVYTIILEDGGEPFGYGHLDPENDTLWLGIYLHPNYRGLGYGKKIMDLLISKSKGTPVRLTVDKNNYNAIALYTLCGFNVVDDLDKYLIMECKNG